MTEKNSIKIHFLGAAGCVTGSKYLLDNGQYRIMVDCGLFQGLKELRVKNWEALPVNAEAIDAVLLSHGHLDHVGFLPRLVRMGFKGSILGTAATLDIARIILLDSARIQEEEAERANEEGYSKHHPAKALYTVDDALKTFEYFHNAPEGESLEMAPGITAKFQYNAHIIGATFIELNMNGKTLVFSGDVGRINDVLLKPPKRPTQADILFIESTYGDRLHPKDEAEKILRDSVLKTIEKGGSLYIPSFAVERTQTIMYLLWRLRENKEIPEIPMIMDSPMGSEVLTVFLRYQQWHKLSEAECIRMCRSFRIVSSYRETWEIIDKKEPKIVIAGSGMVTGGRILTYLQYALPKAENGVLLVGYQAEGTRGRKLLDGDGELKIRGKWIKVKANIEQMEVLSSHADRSELLHWLGEISSPPERIFITHGEPDAAEQFKQKLESNLGWKAEVPGIYEIIEV